MSGKVTVLTPTDTTGALELGRTTWRKQLLPIGELNYKGRQLRFTRDYIDNVVAAFKDRAYDAVPLQLAPDDNSHTNAVDRAAGEIIGLEATEDGLYGTVSLTDKGADIVREHPNLGVSVRLVEEYERGDGKSWPVALQHVLATWAPRVAGMKPWQSIECAEETGQVIDLSALVFSPRRGPAGELEALDLAPQQATETPVQPGGEPTKGAEPVAQLTEEELAAVRAVLPIFKKLDEDDDPKPVKTETAPEPAKFTEPAATEEAGEEAPAEEAEAQLVNAADDSSTAVELALVEHRTQMDRMAIELAEVRAREDAALWKNESESLVRDYGIPPAIVALAEPLLRGRKHVVELAEGKSVDAGETLRSVLHTVAKTYGRKVDLSGPQGTSQELSQADDDAAERDAFLTAQRAAGFAAH